MIPYHTPSHHEWITVSPEWTVKIWSWESTGALFKLVNYPSKWSKLHKLKFSPRILNFPKNTRCSLQKSIHVLSRYRKAKSFSIKSPKPATLQEMYRGSRRSGMRGFKSLSFAFYCIFDLRHLDLGSMFHWGLVSLSKASMNLFVVLRKSWLFLFDG